MKNLTGEKLKGNYNPTVLGWVVFSISVIVPTILFAYVFGGSSRGAIKIFPFVLFFASVISSEINLRRVTVDSVIMSSHGPFRLYRQKLEWSDIEGVRKNGDSPVEVLYRGRAIVFASNRRFKKTMAEIMHKMEQEDANQPA